VADGAPLSGESPHQVDDSRDDEEYEQKYEDDSLESVFGVYVSFTAGAIL